MMEENVQKKSGFVTLIGRPNVGKSTLMNHLIGQKIAITSDKPQTTRNRIQTVYTDERGQIIFLDTPGFPHKPGLSRPAWDPGKILTLFPHFAQSCSYSRRLRLLHAGLPRDIRNLKSPLIPLMRLYKHSLRRCRSRPHS